MRISLGTETWGHEWGSYKWELTSLSQHLGVDVAFLSKTLTRHVKKTSLKLTLLNLT